ncbi:MAG TPA: cyclic nucleotide-binding domain-containing protein [Acidimicrobiia bacterium]|nr:cyclic nucleotide-binding domain-containing protein [Acidimicrobiia bacterium]
MSYTYRGPIQRPTQSARAAKVTFARISLAKREELLGRVPMFAELKKGQLRNIARNIETVRYPAREEIVTEGSVGDFCAVIVDGDAEVVRKGKKIAVLGAGDIFGELAIVDPGPRSAAVRSLTEVTAIKIHQETFAEVVTADPRISLGIMQVLGRRLRETTSRLD